MKWNEWARAHRMCASIFGQLRDDRIAATLTHVERSTLDSCIHFIYRLQTIDRVARIQHE